MIAMVVLSKLEEKHTIDINSYKAAPRMDASKIKELEGYKDKTKGL